MKLGDAAAALGKGLMAGLIGTVVMTVSSTIEMKLRERPASTASAEVLSKVLGVQPVDDEAKQRLSSLAHWGYGTSWGLMRGLLDLAGVDGKCAALTQFLTVWGAALVMLPALEVSPPVTKWSPEEIGVDAFHHMVYAAATSIAYEILNR